MPSCAIIQCGAKKDETHKDLTLHLFPTNETMQMKWLKVIGEKNLRDTVSHRPYVCSLHFEKNLFTTKLHRTRLLPNAVPSLNLLPKQRNLLQNQKETQIEAIINKALVLADNHLSQKISTAANRPPAKVQPGAALAPGSNCNCDEEHPTTLTPVVIVDIPPAAAAIDTIKPFNNFEIPKLNDKKEEILKRRCVHLNKQLRATRERLRRRERTIKKLEAERTELQKQHNQSIEVMRRSDHTDYQLEDILHKAVLKLS